MDGLLIEVLGLRGCGCRQVPTCACRINLQLRSRALSLAFIVVACFFLLSSHNSLSSFHRYTPFLLPFLSPPLFSPTHMSPLFSLRTTLDSDYYIFFPLFHLIASHSFVLKLITSTQPPFFPSFPLAAFRLRCLLKSYPFV